MRRRGRGVNDGWGGSGVEKRIKGGKLDCLDKLDLSLK